MGQALGIIFSLLKPFLSILNGTVGLGMFCELLCKALPTLCPYEPHRQLKDLNPYDHLRRFFRICVTHFKRNVNDLRTQISPEVKSAMLSIASSDPHPDLDGAFAIIEKGSAKARGKILTISSTKR
jgi:hypothetical protein